METGVGSLLHRDGWEALSVAQKAHDGPGAKFARARLLGIRRRGQRLLDGPLITFFNLAAYGVFTPSLFVLLRQ